jgi:hypothetical protein
MLLVDAHVHVYPCFDLAGFFSAAARQFQAASAAVGPGSDFLPIIVLADWSRQSWFRQFKHSADRPQDAQRLAVPGWSFRPTGDQLSVQVESAAGQRMVVLAGRKIISAENLEVLALGTTGAFEDGLSLAATIEAIRRHPDGPVPVVPWAVGKWWGRRGKVLEDVMRHASEPFFYLCDNGNRPSFWPRPSHFQLADRLGIRVLAGSDPLHFASDGLRVGRYGFVLPVREPLRRPASDFKQALAESAPEPIQLFGPLESTDRFLINQIRMQIFKKKWKKELLK